MEGGSELSGMGLAYPAEQATEEFSGGVEIQGVVGLAEKEVEHHAGVGEERKRVIGELFGENGEHLQHSNVAVVALHHILQPVKELPNRLLLLPMLSACASESQRRQSKTDLGQKLPQQTNQPTNQLD